MANIKIEVDIKYDSAGLNESLDHSSFERLVDEFTDSIVGVANSKDGIYGAVNFYLNRGLGSSVNFV